MLYLKTKQQQPKRFLNNLFFSYGKVKRKDGRTRKEIERNRFEKKLNK